MKLHYRFDTRVVTISSFFIIVGLVSMVLGHGTFTIDPFVILIVLFWILFISNFAYGTYAELDKSVSTFTRTDGFFFKKKFALKEIRAMCYQPTWKVGTTNRSLYIIGIHDGRPQTINFPNLGFSEKTIATIAKDLKNAIPKLETDNHVEDLIKKYIT